MRAIFRRGHFAIEPGICRLSSQTDGASLQPVNAMQAKCPPDLFHTS